MTKSVRQENFTFIGHAIVSANGMIADRNGEMPDQLRVPADWEAFQAALDKSDLVILGRKGHTRHPNPGRKRLVLTGSVDGLVQDANDSLSHFWNPAISSLEEVLAKLGLESGTLAITGGQGGFDLFAPLLDVFELVECPDFTIPDGIACFSTGDPRSVLTGLGLIPAPPRMLDPQRGVTVTHWIK